MKIESITNVIPKITVSFLYVKNKVRSYLVFSQPGDETFGEIPSVLIVLSGVHCEKSVNENIFIESKADNRIPLLIFITKNLLRSYAATI